MTDQDKLSSILDRILAGDRTEADIEKLRQFLRLDGDVVQLVSQDGKFNTNIGKIEGGTFHIGDIHQGADAETIEQLILKALQPLLNKSQKPLLNRDELNSHLEAMDQSDNYAKWGTLTSRYGFSRAIQPRFRVYKGSDNSTKTLLPHLLSFAMGSRILLLAESGGGKTSAIGLLIRLLIEKYLSENEVKINPIPIAIELRNYDAGEKSLLPLICSSMRQYGALNKLSEDQVEALLEDVPCIIFLDGLNEISPDDRDSAKQLIIRLTQNYARCSFVMTCRISDFIEDFADLQRKLGTSNFKIFELCRWQPSQVEQYLRYVVPESTKPTLFESQDLVSWEIFSNPLILELACEIGLENIGQPINQVDILRSYIRSVIERTPDLSVAMRLKLLPTVRKVAYELCSQQRSQMEIDELYEEIESIRGRQGYEPDAMFSTLRQSGLIKLEINIEKISFFHKYVQEYLCSEYLEKNFEPEQIIQLAERSWWRQCLSFYLRLSSLPVETLLKFLGSSVDRWVRYEAAEILGELGDPRLGSMVVIPAGALIMGRDDGSENEKPAHSVELPAFEIDVYSVTNIEYWSFIKDTGYPPPPHWVNAMYLPRTSNHPVVNVSWEDARTYAKWVKKRLPTEAEWEKAASWFEDGSKFLWPWGNEFAPKKLNSDTSAQDWVGSTTPVGVYLEGESRYGVYDMCGNVWEWTSSILEPYPYNSHDGREDPTRAGLRVLRGGGWRSPHSISLTTTRRDSFSPDPNFGNVGFRCVRDLK